jgi:hypothetical protein
MFNETLFMSRILHRYSAAAILIIIVLTLDILLPSRVDSAAGGFEEYSIKSAFVLNFARFVQWTKPPAGVKSPNTCELCLMGSAGILSGFETINGQTVGSQTIRIRNVGDSANLDGCQILFLSREVEHAEQLRALSAVSDKPILTIGEVNNFARIGGIIGLINKSGKLGFEINVENARRQNLRVSSHLLKLATVVGTP